MINRSIHFSLSCDSCGLSFGEIGDIENIPGILKNTKWGIIGNKHYCERCKESALEKQKKETNNPDLKIIDPEEGGKLKYGSRTKNGWVKSSERMPEKISKGSGWVFGRTVDGKVGVCRWSNSLGIWVDERNEPIEEGVEWWTYLPDFP